MRQQLLMRHLESVSMRIDASIAELNHLKSTIQWLKTELPENSRSKLDIKPVIENTSNDNYPDRPSDLIRIKEVSHILGLAKSTIYRYLSEDNFPKPINIGARAVAWRRGDIEKWIDKFAK